MCRHLCSLLSDNVQAFHAGVKRVAGIGTLHFTMHMCCMHASARSAHADTQPMCHVSSHQPVSVSAASTWCGLPIKKSFVAVSLQEFLHKDLCMGADGSCMAQVSSLMPEAMGWLDGAIAAGSICGAEDVCGSRKPLPSQVGCCLHLASGRINFAPMNRKSCTGDHAAAQPTTRHTWLARSLPIGNRCSTA